ncbi:MAG: hypothetical protein GQ578_10855 [Desulfuromonadaceae bacterium]|nr:hypothetical protein [Desulfuromonadaceae bacterium]
MDQRAIIDVICKAGIKNLATEIGALLGQELTCSDIQFLLSSKDTLFSDPGREKTAFTRMSVSGDKEGACYLLTRLDSAIILGGTLIMLPEEMIEENAQGGKLDGELSDAFGEVANIIAGVFTQAFVDKYSKTLRFIKETVEELVPTKIDPASDQPFPPGNYYVASCILSTAEKNLGLLEFVVPASIFELEDAAPEEPPEIAETPAQQEPKAAETIAEPTPEPRSEPAGAAEPAPAEESEPPPPPKPAFADAKKLTDVVFTATINQLGEEIGALLGKDLVCDDIQLLLTTKSDFFSNHCMEKVTMAHLKISGDREGLGFMFTQIPDAVVLGGTLIMLPEDQIEEQSSQGLLDGEIEDAFGEVANILAGGLTQVFLDRYSQQIRFVRTESEIIVPTKIDPTSDTPFPEGSYYLASFAIHLEEHELHRILLLFPAEIFDLDGHEQAAADQTSSRAQETTPATAVTAAGGSAGETSTEPVAADSDEKARTTEAPAVPAGPPIVLVISEDSGDAEPFSEILSTADYDCKVLSFQEDIKEQFQKHQILGAFLVMSQVSEKGFATAIKLQSTGQPLPPMIFAGPEWTRSTVLRAVKYGARDILILPASGDEIQQKLNRHFRKAG